MTAAQDSRELFEEWFRQEFKSELYCSTQWMAWQASLAALSAEPVAEVACTHVQGWCTRWIEVDGKRNIPPLGTKLYAAPKPAAQERKPLTDAQIEGMLINWPKDGIAFFDFARAIERAHGITGE